LNLIKKQGRRDWLTVTAAVGAGVLGVDGYRRVNNKSGSTAHTVLGFAEEGAAAGLGLKAAADISLMAAYAAGRRHPLIHADQTAKRRNRFIESVCGQIDIPITDISLGQNSSQTR
jgi:hypothetical protein